MRFFFRILPNLKNLDVVTLARVPKEQCRRRRLNNGGDGSDDDKGGAAAHADNGNGGGEEEEGQDGKGSKNV